MIFLGVSALVFVACIWIVYLSRRELQNKTRRIDRQFYEVTVLREISEKIGYELNVEKILDIVLASLNKLIPFTVAGFMLLRENQKILFKAKVNERTGRMFVDNVKARMLTVLNGQVEKNFEAADTEEILEGDILDFSAGGVPASFWITPLVINNRGVGVLAVSSARSNYYTGEEMEVLKDILEQANLAVNKLERLLESEKGKLGALVFSLMDAILMFDENGYLVVANPAAQKLLNLVPGDGTTISEAVHILTDRIDIRTKFEESVRGDRMVLYEDLVIKERFYRLVITPVKNDLGRVLGGVILFHDTTPGKELERLREDFTAMMVHELRAPLTVVRGTADMFLTNDKLASSKDGRELLQTMRGSVESMLGLVNDLLDVSKIEAGKFQVDKSLNNICDVVKEAVTAFLTIATGKNIQLLLDVSDGCPSFLFDQHRIAQVVNNLLSNAVKYTPPQGKVTVKVLTINDGSSVKIDITDTGEGMTPAQVSDLFSKFKQVGEKKEGGTGLGLVIAKGIVEAHAGQLLVQSQPGLGSTFSVVLPVVE
jgi:signal transduction histidine kinase